MKAQILKLGKDSVIYGFGTVATRVLALLLLPLFTAYLTPGDYGALALAMMLGQVVQPVFALGLGAGMGPSYYDGDNEERKAATVWTAFAVLVLSSAVLMLAAVMASDLIGRQLLGGEGHTSVVLLALAAVAVNNLATPFTLRLQFENRASQFVVVTVVSTLVTFAVSVLTVVFWGQGVLGMLQGQLAGQAAGMLLSLCLVARTLRFVRPTQQIAAALMRTSLPLMPSFAFLFVILHGNKYFLSELSGLEPVGIYSVGFSIGMAISVVVGAVQTAWYPYFMSYANRQQEAPALFSRILTYYTFVVGGIALLFFVFARPTVHLLTQDAFHDSYRVVGLVAASQFLVGMFSLLLPPLYFAAEVKYVSIVQCVAAVVLCVMSLLLIPPFGYVGAALALLLACLTMVLTLAVWNRRRAGKYLQITFDRARVLPFAAFGAVIGAVLLLPFPFIWWQQVLAVLLGSSAVVACVLLLLGKGERDALRQLALGRRPV